MLLQGMLLQLLHIPGMGLTRTPQLCLQGRRCTELTPSTAAKPRPQTSRPYPADLSPPWPHGPLVMGSAPVMRGQLRFHGLSFHHPSVLEQRTLLL